MFWIGNGLLTLKKLIFNVFVSLTVSGSSLSVFTPDVTEVNKTAREKFGYFPIYCTDY